MRQTLLALIVFTAPAALAELPYQELPIRSAQPTARRFTTMDPLDTGLVAPNPYADPAMWREKYPEFAFGSLGTGIAIGDYDADGRPDVFVVSKDGASRLFRNLGKWKFQDVTDSAGLMIPAGAWTQGATFTDVNNDGRLDLYLCRHKAPNLLFVNRGDGTFEERAAAAGLAITDASVMATFFDYDRDGWLDVYLQTNLSDSVAAPQGQRDYLFRNDGQGAFRNSTDPMRVFGHTQGHAATPWDFDRDSWPDLYVSNDFLTPDQLYHNWAGKVLGETIDAVVPYFPHFAMGADLGDVNNDGILDLFVADMLPTDRDQNVRGMLNLQATMARDIPVGAAAQYMRNMLYIGTGTNRHVEAGFLSGLAASGWTWSVRFEDLDEDGRVDLHVTNGMVRDFLDNDLISKMANLPFEQRRRLVMAAPELREPNRAYRNQGNLRFDEVGADWGLSHAGISFGSATGDLDGDGDLDLVFANYQGNPTALRNNSHEHHRVVFALRGSHSNRLGIGALVRVESAGRIQVRQLSLARGYASSSEPVAHFGLGNVATIDRVTITWPNGAVQNFHDLPADRRYSVVEPQKADDPSAAESSKAQFVEAGSRLGLPLTDSAESEAHEFVSQPLLPFRKQGAGPGLALGDLNGDGLDDLIVGGLAGIPMRMFAQTAGGLQTPVALASRDHEVADAAPLILDLNRDAIPDLFLAKSGVNLPAGSPRFQPELYLGTAAGSFTPAPNLLPKIPISAGPVVAADWNRDGWIDLFIGGRVTPGTYPTAPRSALLTSRAGHFENTTASDAPGLEDAGLANAALWSDADGDGWVDLLVCYEWGLVRCWRNEAGRSLKEATHELGFAGAGTGLWQSITPADFNGDGRMDYAVGNLGLNTRYHASPDAPMVLLRTPLTAQGASQIVEAETLGGRLVPVRGRNQLAAVMPELPRRFSTYRSYAAATLDDILGPARMAAADVYRVTELRSGIFLSGPDGFRFKALPADAQLAPVFGMASGDFDGDGHADLYAVQNWFAPHPETGRFSGGVSTLVRGDGRGGFSSVPAGTTGLLVPGDAKALVTFDQNRDGWPDFLISRRGSPHLLFLNQGVPGLRCLAVRLAGGAHPAATASARITTTTAGGVRRIGDIAVGGGYLSQSVPEFYVPWRREDLPLTIQVTWADGQSTTQTWSEDATRLVITAPPAHE
jgi:hypothetical protein